MTAKRQRQYAHMEFRKVADCETGEVRLALVASHPVDRRLLAARKLRQGETYRVEIKRARNPAFHRLVHALGGMLVEHVAGFESLDAHGALKRVQREAGVQCEEMTIDLGTLGKVPVAVPRSLAFDEMDEAEFHAVFNAIVEHVAKTYWPGLEPHAVEAMAELVAA